MLRFLNIGGFLASRAVRDLCNFEGTSLEFALSSQTSWDLTAPSLGTLLNFELSSLDLVRSLLSVPLKVLFTFLR
mgnify:CR=1 FL=1